MTASKKQLTKRSWIWSNYFLIHQRYSKVNFQIFLTRVAKLRSIYNLLSLYIRIAFWWNESKFVSSNSKKIKKNLWNSLGVIQKSWVSKRYETAISQNLKYIIDQWIDDKTINRLNLEFSELFLFEFQSSYYLMKYKNNVMHQSTKQTSLLQK